MTHHLSLEEDEVKKRKKLCNKNAEIRAGRIHGSQESYYIPTCHRREEELFDYSRILADKLSPTATVVLYVLGYDRGLVFIYPTAGLKLAKVTKQQSKTNHNKKQSKHLIRNRFSSDL